MSLYSGMNDIYVITYSGMNKDYYGKPYHPTQPLHQYDCVVRNSDKIIYFGDMLRNEFQYHHKRQEVWTL